jgi:hypothetical protein
VLNRAPIFEHIVAVAFIQGAMTEFVAVAEQGGLVHVVGDDHVADAVASNEARVGAAMLLGPGLGGLLFGFGRGTPFAAGAGLSLMAALTLSGIRRTLQGETDAHEEGNLLDQIGSGMRWLWGKPFFRTAALAGAATNVTWGAIDLVLIVRVDEHGWSSLAAGATIAMMGCGGIAGSFMAAWLRRRMPIVRLFCSVFLVEGALLPLIALTSHPFLLGLIACVASLGGAAWNSAIVSARMLMTPDHLRARVGAAVLLITSSLLPFGVLTAGVLLASVGSTVTALCLAGWQLALAAAVLVAPSVREGLPARA